MMNLVLHPRTSEQVAQFIGRPSHAVLLIGSNGIGKTVIAESMVTQILELEPGKLAQHPYYTVISPVKGTISIDAIRELQKFLQLKTLGQKPLRRAVIVEHAEGLTVEAQNAFLKLLEEPPADTLMVLTADNQRALLPTISSRVQAVTIYGPTEEMVKEYFTGLGKEATVLNQAYFLSGGMPGLMHALLDGDETHPLMDGVATAKIILQKQLFERLALVEGLSKQRDTARFVLEALQHIAQTGLEQAGKKSDAAKLKQWHHVLSVVTDAKNALVQNANTKLVLSNLMLRI